MGTGLPHAAERRRKVSVTVDPALLHAVDAFVAAHPRSDRIKVVDEALSLWYARQQELAMAAQFTAPKSPAEHEERAARCRIQRAAAGRIFRAVRRGRGKVLSEV